MTISFNIELNDLEQSVLNERTQRFGVTIDEWAKQVILRRIEGISRPHKMAQARELFDKFHAAPEDVKQRLMAVPILKDQGHK